MPKRRFGPVSESIPPIDRGRDRDLLDALRSLAQEKKQARVTCLSVVQRFGLPIGSRAEVDRFLAWMKAEGLAASTSPRSSVRSDRFNPRTRLHKVHVKVPHRCVHQEVLSKDEIQQVLEDLKSNEEWFYPCFSFGCLRTRNSKLIGLTWDAVRFAEGEVLINKTLKMALQPTEGGAVPKHARAGGD